MRFVSASLLALVLAACGGDDASSSSTSGSTAAPGTTCAADTRKDVYAAGLTKPAGTLTLKLVSANPAPPSVGNNKLVLQISDASGAAIDGATVTVTPFMPDHGHGSAVKPSITAAGGGSYTVDNVYLAMAGLWQLIVDVAIAPGNDQKGTFQFCLDG